MSTYIKWLPFTGTQEDFSTWSTCFLTLCPTKGLYDTLIDEDENPVEPTALGATPNVNDQTTHDRELLAYRKQLAKIERCKNEQTVLPSNGTRIFQLDNVQAWLCRQKRQKQRSRCLETIQVEVRERWGDQICQCEAPVGTPSAQRNEERYSSTSYGHRSRTWNSSTPGRSRQRSCSTMFLNCLPPRYEHFVVQETFNPASNFMELRTMLTIDEKSRATREIDE